MPRGPPLSTRIAWTSKGAEKIRVARPSLPQGLKPGSKQEITARQAVPFRPDEFSAASEAMLLTEHFIMAAAGEISGGDEGKRTSGPESGAPDQRC
jgi:hypothetical protein